MMNPLNIFKRGDSDNLTTRGLAVQAKSINEDERSVEAVLSTETRATVFDWERGDFIEEILLSDGAVLPKQAPLLDAHSRGSITDTLGSIREMAKGNGSVTGRLYFAEGVKGAEAGWQLVRQGHMTDVSVGYRVDAYIDIPAGEKRSIKGREFEAGQRGLRVTTKWTLREVSLVPIGADSAAKIRNENRPGFQPEAEKTQRSQTMNKWLRSLLVRIGLRSEATDEQAHAFLETLAEEKRQQIEAEAKRAEAEGKLPETEAVRTAPEAVRAAQVVDVAGEVRAAIEAERKAETERTNQIRGLAELAQIPATDELVSRAISENWTAEKARGEFVTALRTRRADGSPGSPGIHIANANSATPEVLAAGLMHRCGIDVERGLSASHGRSVSDASKKHFAEVAERGWGHRDRSMLDLCRDLVRCGNLKDPATGLSPSTREEYIRAAVSGSALTHIFTTSVNAQLMMSYVAAPDSTAGWVAEVDVNDFKTNDRIGIGPSGQLEKLPRGATATDASFSDIQESYKIARYAKKFTIDEQDIIDDNMNALTRVPMEMAMAAARLRADLVYSILLANAALSDGSALFIADPHGNLVDAALAIGTLKTAITAMRKQTYSGVNLNLQPAHLITSTTLDFTARELLNSTQMIIAGTAGAITERGNANVVSGLGLQLHSDSRLDNGVTDPASGTVHAGTATAWFLAASPAMGRTIEVGYLAGTGRAPQVRPYVLSQGQYGIGWDIKLDIGAKALDYRGLVRGNS